VLLQLLIKATSNAQTSNKAGVYIDTPTDKNIELLLNRAL
jgi:hypothetical protein